MPAWRKTAAQNCLARELDELELGATGTLLEERTSFAAMRRS